MNNTLIIVLVAIVLFMVVFKPGMEKFSTSGLAIPDPYCDKLVATYYQPKNQNPKCHNQAGKRVCGMKRRNSIDYKTGNYYLHNGMLV
mgnify:CR=1 FL=1